jgi:hypothetical protein
MPFPHAQLLLRLFPSLLAFAIPVRVRSESATIRCTFRTIRGCGRDL